MPDGSRHRHRRQAPSCCRHSDADRRCTLDPLAHPDTGHRRCPTPPYRQIHRLTRPEQPLESRPVAPPSRALELLVLCELERPGAGLREERRCLARGRSGRVREAHIRVRAGLVGDVGIGDPPRREERQQAGDEDRCDQPAPQPTDPLELSVLVRITDRASPSPCPCPSLVVVTVIAVVPVPLAALPLVVGRRPFHAGARRAVVGRALVPGKPLGSLLGVLRVAAGPLGTLLSLVLLALVLLRLVLLALVRLALVLLNLVLLNLVLLSLVLLSLVRLSAFRRGALLLSPVGLLSLVGLLARFGLLALVGLLALLGPPGSMLGSLVGALRSLVAHRRRRRRDAGDRGQPATRRRAGACRWLLLGPDRGRGGRRRCRRRGRCRCRNHRRRQRRWLLRRRRLAGGAGKRRLLARRRRCP